MSSAPITLPMHKVLLLGAGMIARPIIRYLLDKNIRLTVADRDKSQAAALIGNHPGGLALQWDIGDEQGLDALIANHDITVSLLPWQYHPRVAISCLRHKRHLVTTSYVKPEMKALDLAAREAGIIFLNELGLDPGIDHMSAMRIIDRVHGSGSRIEGFYSICGALPAPEVTPNPFRYTFSWSPKGVVMASNNDARFLRDGKMVAVPSRDLFKNPLHLKFCPDGRDDDTDTAGMILEVYPNRDSLPYIDLYGIPETKTMVRGTLRYPGWCNILDNMKRLGLLSAGVMDFSGKTFAGFMAMVTGEEGAGSVRERVAKYLGTESSSPAISAMEWLGLFDNSPMDRGMDRPFEIVSDLMAKKMMLRRDQRDMVVLQHIFLVLRPDGSREVIKSSLVKFGSPLTDTAVALTVALPAAIGVELLLKGMIRARGVRIPVIPEIYEPILDELENLGIKMTEQHGLPVTEFGFLDYSGQWQDEPLPGMV
jgi:saccharopine dehydrogenase-like NADP-dependent oxidoreductase